MYTHALDMWTAVLPSGYLRRCLQLALVFKMLVIGRISSGKNEVLLDVATEGLDSSVAKGRQHPNYRCKHYALRDTVDQLVLPEFYLSSRHNVRDD